MKNKEEKKRFTISGGLQQNKSTLLKSIVLLLYSILLGITVLKHEPWFDEAQAWLLARDASLIDLFVKYMRYEGSPGLWHLLLMIPAKLGLPYISLNILSALLALAGAWIFMFYSPFPLVIKLLYPFSYFAFYQYGVIARSYSLLPFLLFLIAVVYKAKMEKPLIFIVLLILLSNLSFHGLIIASSLVLFHFLQVNNNWDKLKPILRYKNFIAFLLFGLTVFLIKQQLALPEDLISVAGIKKDFSSIFEKSVPPILNSLAVSEIYKASAYSIFNIFVAFSIFTVTVSLFWFYSNRKLLLFLVPYASMLVFFTIVYVHAWHMGILFYIWLFALWLSFEKNGTAEKAGSTNQVYVMKKLMVYTISLVLVIQVFWSFKSIAYDLTNNYSASREAAYYIKEMRLTNKKLYVTNFHSISILPYFEQNIFCNYNDKRPPSFWIWSHQNSMYNEPYLSFEKYDPDYILLGIKNYTPDIKNISKPFVPEIPGFTYKKLFAGALYWKNKPLETDSFILFVKNK